MYIKRNIEQQVLRMSSQYPVICVVGARSCGKSTMLNHILPDNYKSCSLDSEFEISICKKDPRAYIMSHGLPLFIDEVQKVPELFNEIKDIVDTKARNNEDTNGLFWLSGSNRIDIEDKANDSLAGRIAIINMSTLSQEEISAYNNGVFNPFYQDIEKREFKNKPLNQIFEQIFKGGYPKLFNDNVDRDPFYQNYISTYIERDIKGLIKEQNISQFTDLISLLSGRVGEQLNIEELSSIIGSDIKTVKNWLSILEKTGIIYLLKPYNNKLSKRLVKMPKLYFMDTGLACYMARWLSADQVRIGASSGHFLENYVISEIIKSHYNNLIRLDYMFYYRDYDQKEFDILFADNMSLVPFEIKQSTNPKTHPTNYLDKFNLKCDRKYLLYGGDKKFEMGDGWIYLPISIV